MEISSLLPTTATLAWLYSTSLKAALLLASSWLCATLLRRGSAAARHQVWALGVAGALVLPLLCWALPMFTVPSSYAGRSALGAAIVLTGGLPASSGSPWRAWLVLPWALGTGVVLLRVLRSHLAARRLGRAAEPAEEQVWLLARDQAAASLGIAPNVEIRRSDVIVSPMTVGLLRPRVLLPAAAHAWSVERLRAALTHELGHVRRRDTAVQLCAQLVCALYWWNPLAWLAARRLRVEREHACDDLVLGAGVRPTCYAADLLALAERLSTAGAPNPGVVCMADPSGTEARLRRILDANAPRRPPGAGFRGATHAAALSLVFPLACASAPLAGPAPALTFSIGTPSSLDEGDPDTLRPPASLALDLPDLTPITEELARHRDELERCYARRLQDQPALSGMVVMHWTIGRSGKVIEQCVTQDSTGDEEIVACVNQVIAGANFPAQRDPLSVSYPFLFGVSADEAC